MELLVEVRIRDKETGAESVLWSDLESKQAYVYIEHLMSRTDLNNMPEYIIRPYLSRRPATGRISYESKQKKVIKVSEPQD